MRVYLIHVRDPQFYAFPSEELSERGVPQILGFPPIGIMSLSSVLQAAGHECELFDQANPNTPNSVIVERIQAGEPDLVGLSFLSTTSYPYAKILVREIRASCPEVKIAFGGVFVSLNGPSVKQQCPEVDFVCRGDGEQLILDLLDRMDEPETVSGVTWADEDGKVRHNIDRRPERDLDQWPFPDRASLQLDFLETMPLDVPAVLSLDRYSTMQTSRGCPWPCVFCDIPVFNEGKWRSRSPEHVVAELERMQAEGYGAVYFVDDHFLLQPKRIEAICQGIIDKGITIQWGCEGRVDSVCMELFPLMARANCRSLMFGIESGSQTVLDRLKKEQTLEEVEHAVEAAKKAGIEIVHGFFVVGSPDETEEDLRQTFRFASRLRIDSFGFNRLCVYRGTPLWSEYVERGLVDDQRDWYKYYKCSEIDPTVLPGETIHRIRSEELRRLMLYKLGRHPLQSLRLLRRFAKHMPLRDVLFLLVKPFLGQKSGATQAEVLSRAVEHDAAKSEAADLTQLTDEEFAHALPQKRAASTARRGRESRVRRSELAD